MSMGDRITILVAVGAVSATLGVGSWSTNARINDVNTQLNARIDGVRAQLNTRIDDMGAQLNARIDDVQEDIRELRALVIDALKHGDPAD